MLFLGQPGGMADRKEKSRELEQSFVLDFFATFFNQVKKVEDIK
jgi:hypothetical protein